MLTAAKIGEQPATTRRLRRRSSLGVLLEAFAETIETRQAFPGVNRTTCSTSSALSRRSSAQWRKGARST